MDKERFCATCYSHRRPEGGSYKTGKFKRWICQDCTAKAQARNSGLVAAFAPKPPEKEHWRHR